MTTARAALCVEGLRVSYPGPPEVRALDGISLRVDPGECLAIFGESGSGKSTLARVLIGVENSARIEGRLHLGELDLEALDEVGWRAVRWRRISWAPQSASSLNPVLPIGLQLAEPQQVHLARTRGHSDGYSREVLDQVGLHASVLDRYPGELSGGQKRQVLLALALVCDPSVVLLDEPTAGLDPVRRDVVTATLRRLTREEGRSVMLFGHDLDLIDAVADRVAVLYRGWVAETGPTARVLRKPRSPYTWALLNARATLASIKELRGIRGRPAEPGQSTAGCPFLGRCTQSVEACAGTRPEPAPPDGEDGARLVACIRGGLVPLLQAHGLHKRYRVSRPRAQVAIDGVDLEIRHGEVLGLVGASGAGKSTLAMVLVRLLEADRGAIIFDGADLQALDGTALRQTRRHLQLLFQDPFEALSSRLTVGAIIREPLDVQHLGEPAERDRRVQQELDAVRLPSDPSFLGRFTHQLSGGQLQRVALARALILDPKLLVADEPVSMLDPSEQANLLQLLKQLQVERGMAMLLVSHDLAVVLRTADRVMVMDQGRIVEAGTGTELLVAPRHPVTQGLLAAAGRDKLLAQLII